MRGDLQPRAPNPVIVPCMEYGGMGTGYDCSSDDPPRICVPAPWLADRLGLRWAGVPGEFCGPDRRVVARDPSAATPGPGALLIREETLRQFLDDAGYEIVWTVLGAKEIIGGRPSVLEELQLNGAFMWGEGKIEGGVKGTHRAYPPKDV